MRDLTEGSVTRHLVALSGFIAISMLFQTLYFLAGLYWVGTLGKESIAAVSLAGNLTFLVLALTQMLSVGTMTLVSHAVGAGMKRRAVHAFNQAYILSLVAGVAFAVAAYAFSPLVTVLPLQLLAYKAGLLLGRDIDRPRNLAKSVTVE